MTTQLVNNSCYEVFEIHRTARDIYCLVLRVTTRTSQYIDNGITKRHQTIPENAMIAIIHPTIDKPEFANFGCYTTNLAKIHKTVDLMRESIADPRLEIIVHGKNIKLFNVTKPTGK